MSGLMPSTAIYQVLHTATVVSFFERRIVLSVLRLKAVEDQQQCMCVSIQLFIATSQVEVYRIKAHKHTYGGCYPKLQCGLLATKQLKAVAHAWCGASNQ